MSIRQLLAKFRYFLILPFFLMVVGCTPSEADSQSTETEAPTVTVTALIPTIIPRETATLPSPTAIPSTPTPTPTTVPPTPLPTATLTQEEETVILAELMQTNGGCELPCWWGIVPGESSLETVGEALAKRGFRVGDNSAGIRVADDFGVFMEFELEEGIIQSIRIAGEYLTGTEESPAYSRAFAQGWQRYSLSEVLNRHGRPTQVLIYSPFRADPGSGPAYNLLVFYEQLGIEIQYTGSAEQLNDNHYRACPNLSDAWQIGLFLYQSDQINNVVERILPPDSVSYIASPETVYDRISWPQATGISLESFYEAFSAPEDNACFEFSNQ